MQNTYRAEFVASLFRDLGYAPEIDEVSNVYARRGARGGKVVLVLAHIDTVFPAGTEIRVSRDETFLYGPGIGDNCSNVSGMLTSLEILDALGIETEADIVAVGTVGEEGLGNLRGARRRSSATATTSARSSCWTAALAGSPTPPSARSAGG